MPDDLDDEWRRMNAFGNPAGPRNWVPPVDPLSYDGSTGRRTTRRGRTGLVIGAVIGVLIVATVGTALHLGRHHGVTADGPVVLADGSPVAVVPTTAVHLASDTPVGTCLAAGAPQQERFVPCTAPHRFELVSHERGSGDAYPGDDYWTGPVAEQCYQDTLKYVGLRRDQWPTGLDATSFIPVTQGWAAGDRAIYCVAAWSTDATQSVRHLTAAPAPPAVVPTSAAPEVLTGRLTRVADPTGAGPGCLGITDGDTGQAIVVESATNTYSWTVAVDDGGATLDATSGIVRGSDPFGGDVLVHTGTSVRLTGHFTDYAAPDMCGSTHVFGFTTFG